MFERSVQPRPGQREQIGDGFAVAQASERLGRRTLDGRHVRFQRVEQLRQRRRITPDSRGMKCRLSHALVTIVQRESDPLACRGRLDARERPHGVAPGVRGTGVSRRSAEGAKADVLNTSSSAETAPLPSAASS